jgi:predicted O-methyltransferase YrrM
MSQVPQERWTEVDAYFNAHLAPSDPALDAALDLSAAAGLPPHQVAPNRGKLLQLLARIRGARTMLEIGTLGGFSTIWLARALPADGRLVSLEADPGCAEVARANVARAGLADVVEIRVGPALESLPRLAEERHDPFDVVFIDADKPSNAESTDPRVRGVWRFTELVGRHPRLTATAVQTVGEKGYDGFVLALVTG